MKQVLYCIVLLGLFSCLDHATDNPNRIFSISNFSNDVVYVYITNKDFIVTEPKLVLFDTSAVLMSNTVDEDYDSIKAPTYRIDSHDIKSVDVYSTCENYDRLFDDKDYVNFFFIKESIMRKYSWKSIVKNQLFDKKLTYTYDELKERRNVIFYKPDK